MTTKNQKHKCSIEALSHFQCGACGQWFTISGFIGAVVSCPVCSVSAAFDLGEPLHSEAQRILQVEKEKAYADGWSDAIEAAEGVIWPAEVWDEENWNPINAIAAAKKSAMKAVRALQSQAGNHASQQRHAVDLPSASLRANH